MLAAVRPSALHTADDISKGWSYCPAQPAGSLNQELITAAVTSDVLQAQASTCQRTFSTAAALTATCSDATSPLSPTYWAGLEFPPKPSATQLSPATVKALARQDLETGAWAQLDPQADLQAPVAAVGRPVTCSGVRERLGYVPWMCRKQCMGWLFLQMACSVWSLSAHTREACAASWQPSPWAAAGTNAQAGYRPAKSLQSKAAAFHLINQHEWPSYRW